MGDIKNEDYYDLIWIEASIIRQDIYVSNRCNFTMHV